MPTPFQAVLLALAAWRVWHLIALDDLTDRPRRYITDGHEKVLDFIECPYCLGAWIAGAWVVFFAVWPSGASWAALVFAVAAAVVIVAHWVTSDE